VQALAAILLALMAHSVAGQTPRSAAERRAFIRENPCPATSLRRGSCPGWEVDHIVPLCAGGPDTRQNMHWLSKDDHRFKTLVDVREYRKLRRIEHLQ
jgi:5-methylcytosine-specific restriction endonuclease McrA